MTGDKAGEEAVEEEVVLEEIEVVEAAVEEEEEGKIGQAGTKLRYHMEENMTRNGY